MAPPTRSSSASEISNGVGHVSPRGKGADDFVDDGPRGSLGDKAEVWTDRDQVIESETVRPAVDSGRVFPHLAGGVHVEGWGQAPAVGGSQEAMITGVIVPVAADDIEGHPPEQLSQLVTNGGGCSELPDRTSKVEVVDVAGRRAAGQGQSGSVQAAALCRPVEATDHERPSPATDRQKLGLGNVDAGRSRQTRVHMLPRPGILPVRDSREFGDPKRPIQIAVVRLGPDTAQ